MRYLGSHKDIEYFYTTSSRRSGMYMELVSGGSLDDFDDSLEMRLIETRGTLDDFTPIVTWHDG